MESDEQPNKKVLFTDAAFDDLADLLVYLNDRFSSRIAEKFMEKVRRGQQGISRFPLMYPGAHGYHSIRRGVLHKYCLLYYRLEKDAIHILRILDSRRSFRGGISK